MSSKQLSLSPSKWYLPYYFIPHLLLALPAYALVIFIVSLVLFSPEGAARTTSSDMDTVLLYTLIGTAVVFALFLINTLLYVSKSSVEISEDSFVITKGGLFFQRNAVPLTFFATSNLSQNPYQLLFGLTTFRIGLLGEHKLPGFNYKAAMQFGQALASGGERSTSFTQHSSFSKTVNS